MRLIRDSQEFEALRHGWDRMLEHGQYNFPFYSWIWHFHWWKHFGHGKDLFVIVGEDGPDDFRFIAPLMKVRTRLRGLPVTELKFLENAIGPRNGILLRTSDVARQAAQAVVTVLSQNCREWDLATLANIDENAPYLSSFREGLDSDGLQFIENVARESPYIVLEEDFDSYLSKTFHRKHRYNIKRAVRRLTEMPDYCLSEFRSPRDMNSALKTAFHVSKASWKGKTNSDMSGSSDRKAFYEDVTHHLAPHGQVRIWVASLADRPIAIQYQLVSFGAIHLLVTDFDAAYGHLSPGTALLYQVLEELHHEGVKEYDFTGSQHDYKMNWATSVRRHVTIELFNRRRYSRSLFTAKTQVLPLLRNALEFVRRAASRRVK